MDIATRKETACRFLELMMNGPTRQQALDMMVDDATWWIPGVGTWDKAQLDAGMAQSGTFFTGPIKMTVTGITAEGDRVALETESDAGVVNGKRYNNRYHMLIVFRGDQIAEVKEYCDTKYVADTLGALMETL